MNHSPIIMVAPNGARKTKKHHPGLPVSIGETVEEAARCFAAGASAIHAHVRGENDEHVLDPGRYKELIRELNNVVPEMLVQVTTEAVGIYTPEQQSDCVKAIEPEMISLAVREMAGQDRDMKFATDFYHWCQERSVHIQHIVYDAEDLTRLLALQSDGVIPEGCLCVLFVLGRFLEGREATAEDIAEFLAVSGSREMDWFVCAFGSHEQECALSASSQGGHARIGFENNLLMADGSVAEGTSALVKDLCENLTAVEVEPASPEKARLILGLR